MTVLFSKFKNKLKKNHHANHYAIVNRPGVARVVLQTPLLLIQSVSQWSFSSEPSKHHYNQTVRARKLKILENVNPPPLVTFHVSSVTCQVSGVMFIFIFHFFYKMVELVGWGVEGLPCLVFQLINALQI